VEIFFYHWSYAHTGSYASHGLELILLFQLLNELNHSKFLTLQTKTVLNEVPVRSLGACGQIKKMCIKISFEIKREELG
jgi:hypothetical protein